MEALVKFLTSDAALKHLGLPGLVILVSFIFYRTLVEQKIIPRLTRNQGFVIIICILMFFAYALKLTIDSQAQSQKTYSSDEMSGLVGKMTMSTPIETYTSYFGQPTAQNALSKYSETKGGDPIETPTSITATQYQWKNNIYVSRYTENGNPYGLALASRNLSISVPHIKFVPDGDTYNDGTAHLDALRLRDIWGSCRQADFDMKLQWLKIGPCYLGAPGDYKQFAFAVDFFDRDGGNCKEDPDTWWAKNHSKKLEGMETDPCSRYLDYKLAAMAVTEYDDSEPRQGGKQGLSAYELLSDFLENYAFGHGFTFSGR